MAEDTCIKECAYYKKYNKKGMNTCPFYLQTTWINDSGTPKVIQDCAHKRAVILLMEQNSRIIGVQQASEMERNVQHKVLQAVASIKKQQKLIPEAEYE